MPENDPTSPKTPPESEPVKDAPVKPDRPTASPEEAEKAHAGTRTGEGSGQEALAEGAPPTSDKPVTADTQLAPGKAGDVAEGKDAAKVQPEPPAVKPVADRPGAPDAKIPSPQTEPPATGKSAAEVKPPPPGGGPPKTAAAPPPRPERPQPTGPEPIPWESEMVARLRREYGSGIAEASTYLGQNYIVVEPAIVSEVLRALRNDEQFDYCVDITAVHYPQREKQFDVIWVLYSFPRNERVRVKAQVHDGESVPSAAPIWEGANWLEREAYDMFGITFEGHPDLRRILLPDGWKGFPLRKDYGIIQQDQEWVQINLGIESGQ